LGLLPDHNRAEDVFQEVFLTVTRKAAEFQPGTNFPAWARSIARLKVLEQLRAIRAAPHLLGPEALEAVLQAAEVQEDDWAQRREALKRCVEQLAPRARQILELRYCDDFLPPPVIAQRISLAGRGRPPCWRWRPTAGPLATAGWDRTV